jgi:hypothetical protein
MYHRLPSWQKSKLLTSLLSFGSAGHSASLSARPATYLQRNAEADFENRQRTCIAAQYLGGLQKDRNRNRTKYLPLQVHQMEGLVDPLALSSVAGPSEQTR